MQKRFALVALALLAGCGGGGDDEGGISSSTTPVAPKGLLYTGTTSQKQTVRIEATPKMLGSIKLQLNCKDGSSSRVTLSTLPTQPTLHSDGSFYYAEAGRTRPREFPGFGSGRYRGAMQGEIVGPKGSGHAAFRITFKETSCRAAVRWAVKRGG